MSYAKKYYKWFTYNNIKHFPLWELTKNIKYNYSKLVDYRIKLWGKIIELIFGYVNLPSLFISIMLTNRLCYLFSNQTVPPHSSRNTKSFFSDMEKVYGTKKIDSRDGLTLDCPQEVHHILVRNQISNQSWKDFTSKWILVRYRLYFRSYQSHPNLQLCSRRNRLSLHPCCQRLETQWTSLWSPARSQQTWNRRKTRQRASPNMEKKLRYSSPIIRLKRLKTSKEWQKIQKYRSCFATTNWSTHSVI